MDRDVVGLIAASVFVFVFGVIITAFLVCLYRRDQRKRGFSNKDEEPENEQHENRDAVSESPSKKLTQYRPKVLSNVVLENERGAKPIDGSANVNIEEEQHIQYKIYHPHSQTDSVQNSGSQGTGNVKQGMGVRDLSNRNNKSVIEVNKSNKQKNEDDLRHHRSGRVITGYITARVFSDIEHLQKNVQHTDVNTGNIITQDNNEIIDQEINKSDVEDNIQSLNLRRFDHEKEQGQEEQQLQPDQHEGVLSANHKRLDEQQDFVVSSEMGIEVSSSEHISVVEEKPASSEDKMSLTVLHTATQNTINEGENVDVLEPQVVKVNEEQSMSTYESIFSRVQPADETDNSQNNDNKDDDNTQKTVIRDITQNQFDKDLENGYTDKETMQERQEPAQRNSQVLSFVRMFEDQSLDQNQPQLGRPTSLEPGDQLEQTSSTYSLPINPDRNAAAGTEVDFLTNIETEAVASEKLPTIVVTPTTAKKFDATEFETITRSVDFDDNEADSDGIEVESLIKMQEEDIASGVINEHDKYKVIKKHSHPLIPEWVVHSVADKEATGEQSEEARIRRSPLLRVPEEQLWISI